MYVSGKLKAGTNLWSVLADGTGAQRLSALGRSDQLDPSWSPDGRSIVFRDCRFKSAGCTLSMLALHGKPVDLSPLRAPYTDTFDRSYYADPLGHAFELGSGTATSVENGQLVETVAAADAERGGPYNNLNAGWGTVCKLVGDFDVQADYKLLEWPATNGVTATLNAIGPGPQVFRESQTWGEDYASFIAPSVTELPTLDTAGTLRLQREGTTAVASYLSTSGWVPIASGPTTLDPAIIDLESSSLGDRFAHQEVEVALGQPPHQLRHDHLPEPLMGRRLARLAGHRMSAVTDDRADLSLTSDRRRLGDERALPRGIRLVPRRASREEATHSAHDGCEPEMSPIGDHARDGASRRFRHGVEYRAEQQRPSYEALARLITKHRAKLGLTPAAARRTDGYEPFGVLALGERSASDQARDAPTAGGGARDCASRRLRERTGGTPTRELITL